MAGEMHIRRCWGCGNIAEHADNVVPEVLCKKCGSRDTRFQRPVTPAEDAPTIGDLAMLVARLVRQIRNHDPSNDVAVKAVDYLRRKDLASSVLREIESTDVMPNFVDVPFPATAAEHIRRAGGRPLMAKQGHIGEVLVWVLVSDDPSGPNGEVERHASVSARTRWYRFMPTTEHVRAALSAVGMDEARVLEGEECVHAYRAD